MVSSDSFSVSDWIVFGQADLCLHCPHAHENVSVDEVCFGCNMGKYKCNMLFVHVDKQSTRSGTFTFQLFYFEQVTLSIYRHFTMKNLQVILVARSNCVNKQ